MRGGRAPLPHPAQGLALQPSRGRYPAVPAPPGSGRSHTPQPRRDPARGAVPPPSGRHSRGRSSPYPPANPGRCSHPSIAEQDKALTSGTESRTTNEHGEPARKWRRGLHGNCRTSPSTGIRSSSFAATEHAPESRARAVDVPEASAISCSEPARLRAGTGRGRGSARRTELWRVGGVPRVCGLSGTAGRSFDWESSLPCMGVCLIGAQTVVSVIADSQYYFRNKDECANQLLHAALSLCGSWCWRKLQ